MEPKEFRIGNYVEWLKDSPFVVKRICDDGNITIGVIGDNNSSIELNKSVEPIPITEEWLLRAGCITNTIDGFTVYLKSVFLVENIFGKWMLRKAISETESIVLCEIPYVHSFQNAWFALTGDELQFKDI